MEGLNLSLQGHGATSTVACLFLFRLLFIKRPYPPSPGYKAGAFLFATLLL